MQIARILIITTIIAFVPVLAFPVGGIESQELLAREPSAIGDWFNNIGKKIKGAFDNLGNTILGKPKSKSSTSKSSTTTTTTTTTPSPTPTPSTASVATRELPAIYAREDDGVYIRSLDDEIYAREFYDDLDAREIYDELE